jgi:hypothetical protein
MPAILFKIVAPLAIAIGAMTPTAALAVITLRRSQ